MSRLLGASWLAAVLALTGCSTPSPFEKQKVGDKFTMIDSLPAPLRLDSWVVHRWVNVEGKHAMSKDGGNCTGHAGILTRERDKLRWLVTGAVCNGKPLLTAVGSELEGHSISTMTADDEVTVEARFVEAMEEGVSALWVTTKVRHKDAKPEDTQVDTLLLRRKGNELQRLLQASSRGGNGKFEGEGFPKSLVLTSGDDRRTLRFSEERQAYTFDKTGSDMIPPPAPAPAPSPSAAP